MYTARTHHMYARVCVRPSYYTSQHIPNGLFRAPFAEGCDLEGSLAKVFRFVFLTVENFLIERYPLLACNLLSRVLPSRKSRPSSIAAILDEGLTDHVIHILPSAADRHILLPLPWHCSHRMIKPNDLSHMFTLC